MLRSMTARQFREWRAYAELEPFDEVRADLRTAHVVQTIRAALGDRVTLPECVLPFGEDERGPVERDWRDIKAVSLMWAEALNGRNKPPEPPAATPMPRRGRRAKA